MKIDCSLLLCVSSARLASRNWSDRTVDKVVTEVDQEGLELKEWLLRNHLRVQEMKMRGSGLTS